MFSVSSLHLSRGTVRQGHGLRVTVRGRALQSTANDGAQPPRSLRIDMAGGALESAPARIRLALQLTMPYTVRRVDGLDTLRNAMALGTDEDLELSFIIGAKGLPDAMVDAALDELVPDSPFLVELLTAGGETSGEGGELFARAVTTAAHIRASLADDGASCALAPRTLTLDALGAQRDKWRARSAHWLGGLWRLGLWLRWWALPLAFTALCWALILPPTAQRLHELARARGHGLLHAAPHRALLRPLRPSVSPHGAGGELRGSTLAHVLPPVPTSLLSAFELGKLTARLDSARAATERAELLHAAALLLGRANGAHAKAGHPAGPVAGVPAAGTAALGSPPALSEAELAAVGARLAELEAHVGALARVRGVFSFVNLCWLLAICGLAVSVGPMLWHVLAPLRRWLEASARWLLRHVLEPLAERAHRWGILELLVWTLAAVLALDGATAFTRDSGVYVALCGAALGGCPCFAYSTSLWGRRLRARALSADEQQALSRLVSSWLGVTLAPLALAFDSQLFGYLAVLAAYAALGFSTACHGLCWAVGFSSKRAMERVCATSALLLAAFVGARELGVGWMGVPAELARRLGAPFASAVAVIGGLTLHLALLIMSSRYYDPEGERPRRGVGPRYARRNALAGGAITLGALFGQLSGSPGLANTSIVFGALWLVEKYAELHLDSGWHGWTLVFVLSLGTYRSSLWLHDHPSFVASLFEP